jgi:hypothetical protein
MHQPNNRFPAFHAEQVAAGKRGSKPTPFARGWHWRPATEYAGKITSWPDNNIHTLSADRKHELDSLPNGSHSLSRDSFLSPTIDFAERLDGCSPLPTIA